ncbi:tyrosine-type recombinase/integrase [Acidipila sp. EB88]|uniref:tyrosine-type recombinase/integrase n=1 Tax=Acidipila sp. EB88 TaxID=2305226 RepID=UPI001F20E4A4|nr:tyrosine-type recombinase/integrase [Acidipila sp. EB88]
MLEVSTKDGQADLRARAVLFFFAIYGLRSIEVSSLLLSDLHLENGTFTIVRAKGGRTQHFMITTEVGEALVAYLSKGRPLCECRNVFVTLHPPFRATTHSSLRCIVAGRMTQLHIESALYSTHALRHSCATELLEEGISMGEIARFLGHRGSRSVGIYAKASKASVKEVAEFSLRELR